VPAVTVRLGFLGAGIIARHHARSVLGSGEDVRITAVHDPDGERAAALSSDTGAAVAAGVDEVIDRSDAVYVCTWTSEHEALVRRVVDAGRAVFCEKPLGPDLAASRRIAGVVAAAGVVNQVGLVLRRAPVFHLARSLAHDDESGRPQAVVFRDDQYLPTQGYYGSSWRADPARAGSGVLLEHSIHDVDLMEWMLGPIVQVSADRGWFHDIDGIEDVATVRARFANGCTGALVTVWHEVLSRLSERRVELFCERRYVALTGQWTGTVTWDGGDGGDGDAATVTGAELEELAARRSPGAGENPDGAFVRAVREGGGAWPAIGEAVRAHEVVDAAYRSAADDGRPVDVPPCTAHQERSDNADG
jgi:predicted dehydrogenase